MGWQKYCFPSKSCWYFKTCVVRETFLTYPTLGCMMVFKRIFDQNDISASQSPPNMLCITTIKTKKKWIYSNNHQKKPLWSRPTVTHQSIWELKDTWTLSCSDSQKMLLYLCWILQKYIIFGESHTHPSTEQHSINKTHFLSSMIKIEAFSRKQKGCPLLFSIPLLRGLHSNLTFSGCKL